MTDILEAGTALGQPPAPMPTPTPVGPVERVRVAVGTLLVGAVVAGAFVLVRSLPDGPLPALLAFLLGVAVIPLVASPLEWWVHRFVYHDEVAAPLAAIHRVHNVHHYAFFPTWRYVTNGPARRLAIRRHAPDVHAARWRNASVRLGHFTWYLAIGALVVWLPAWLSTGSMPFLAGLLAASVVVANLFIVVHDTIHRPGSHRLVEAQPWFAFLDRHHYIHHVDLGANLNFLLPLADLLFGTLRTSLDRGELAQHGSLAAAKSRRTGYGERPTRGHQARQPSERTERPCASGSSAPTT